MVIYELSCCAVVNIVKVVRGQRKYDDVNTDFVARQVDVKLIDRILYCHLCSLRFFKKRGREATKTKVNGSLFSLPF